MVLMVARLIACQKVRVQIPIVAPLANLVFNGSIEDFQSLGMGSNPIVRSFNNFWKGSINGNAPDLKSGESSEVAACGFESCPFLHF